MQEHTIGTRIATMLCGDVDQKIYLHGVYKGWHSQAELAKIIDREIAIGKNLGEL
jgi:hypothetical protein